MAENLSQFVTWSILGLVLVRVPIFLLAFKYPVLCRTYFYIEVVICALTTLAPRVAHLDWVYMAQSYLQTNLINFCLFYCDFWPSLICSSVVSILVFFSKWLVYD